MAVPAANGTMTARTGWTCVLPDGEKYRGNWKDASARNGTRLFPDGNKYSGNWVEDHEHGEGTPSHPMGVPCEMSAERSFR